MSTEKQPHEIVTESIRNLQNANDLLYDLQRGAKLLGLTMMEDTLQEVIVTINCECVRIRQASSQSLDEAYQQAVKGSATLLSGVLAGIDIGKKSNE